MKLRLVCTITAVAMAGISAAQSDDAKQKIATLKAAVQKSNEAQRLYEWIETTVVSAKGEEKSRKQQRCYYGADGALQRVEVSEDHADGGRAPRGIRGKIVAAKKEEMTDYMKQAVELVKSYIPPDASRIQAAESAGKIAIRPSGTGKPVTLEINDYKVPGDVLSLTLDLENNYVTALGVQSLLGEERDPVTMNVRFDRLNDGTAYPAQTDLEASAKQIAVTVQNSGYRKTAP